MCGRCASSRTYPVGFNSGALYTKVNHKPSCFTAAAKGAHSYSSAAIRRKRWGLSSAYVAVMPTDECPMSTDTAFRSVPLAIRAC